jgi:hypothetical protein
MDSIKLANVPMGLAILLFSLPCERCDTFYVRMEYDPAKAADFPIADSAKFFFFLISATHGSN